MNLNRPKECGKEVEVLPLRQGEEETIDLPHSLKIKAEPLDSELFHELCTIIYAKDKYAEP